MARGKSNVLRFFEMLKSIFTPELLQFVVRHGGADDQLFGGDRVTPCIESSRVLQHGSREQYLFRDAQKHGYGRSRLLEGGVSFQTGGRQGRIELRPFSERSRVRFLRVANSKKPDPRAKTATAMLRSCSVFSVPRHFARSANQEEMGCRGQRLSAGARWQLTFNPSVFARERLPAVSI